MKKILLAIMVSLVVPVTAFASPPFDTRSMGMGGIGVSSATALTAPFHNPALVAKAGAVDIFGILIPALGISVYDQGLLQGLVDTIDVIDNAASTDQDLINSLNGLVGVATSVHVGTAIAAVVPFDFLSINVFLQGTGDISVYCDVSPADLIGSPDPDNLQSNAAATGVVMIELGVALAKSQELPVGTLYYGITPKIYTARSINYAVGIKDFDNSNFDINQLMQETTGVNLDLGIAYSAFGATIGVSAKNVIPQTIKVAESLGISSTYSVNPVFTLGASYSLFGYLTIGMDIDLNETKSFENLSGFSHEMSDDYDDTKMFGIGAEVDAFGWLQIRAGYQMNLAADDNSQVTLGFGFSPFGLVGIELAALYGEDNIGVAFQIAGQF